MPDWILAAGLIAIGVLVLAICEVGHQIKRLARIAEDTRPRRPGGEVIDVERDRLTNGTQKRRALW